MQVARVERGRDFLVEQKIVQDVAKLFEDDEIQIRSNAYYTLLFLADFMEGVDSIVDFDINVIQILVDRLVLEPEENIMILVLKLLKTLLEGGRAQGLILVTQAHARLNDHMESRNKEIRELAALNLGSISYNERGKEATITAGSIKKLCTMLDDTVSECRVAATRALCSLAQLKQGKVEIFELKRLDTIISLLDDENDQTRLNVVQLISNLAEYPECREKFKECLDQLEGLHKDKEFALVSRFAKTAIDVIQWLP